MLVSDFVTEKKVSIIDSSLRVEVKKRDPRFVDLIGGSEYEYLVCAEPFALFDSRVFIELFSTPEDAFAYIDKLKAAEMHSEVDDLPGGDSDAG